MKSKLTVMMVLVTQLGLATQLMAATGVREEASMFLVWAFLGMCALIVIVQLMPAMLLTFGLLKSLFGSGKQSPVKVQSGDTK